MSEDYKDDDILKFFLVLGTILLVGTVTWLFLHEQISSGIRWIRVFQMYFLTLFTDNLDPLREQLVELHGSQISLRYIVFTTEQVMGYFRLPIAIILGLFAILSMFMKFDSKYTRKLGLEKIIEEHAKAFPVITPITKFNPIKSGYRTLGDAVPSKMAAFAEALTPEEWVAYQAVPMPNNQLDTVITRQGFAKQLGKRWRSPERCPPYMQALFVAFAMKGAGLRRESDYFLGELSKCWDPKKGMKLSKVVRKTMREHINNPKTGRMMAKIALRHAFTSTAMLRLLQLAREQGGVLAPAQFLWLRAVDRHLWYALNNLGRAAIHIEAAGSIAHYRAEKSSNKPIPNPKVETAVDGLTHYLDTQGYTGDNPTQPIPPRDYRGENHGSGARIPG